MKKRDYSINETEQLQKREKTITRSIIGVSIIIGILIAIVLIGLLEIF